MDPITQQTALASAGATAAEGLYVDDLFSTYLYEGNQTISNINNGIDLSGEGGLVWTKQRGGTEPHSLCDTERGVGEHIRSNSTIASLTDPNGRLRSFNSSGYQIGTDTELNQNGTDFVSWTFRKAPGFFDVVTYTGNGTAGRQISHNLGSVPGCIIIKCTSHSDNWYVHHRSTGATKVTLLNTTNAAFTSDKFNDTLPTSTYFELPADASTNGTGRTFVAYIFAHDDQSFGKAGDEAIIKCGSYTGNGTTSNTVTLGFEPQWLLIKRTDTGGYDWHMFDVMRGMTGGSIQRLYANTVSAESLGSGYGVEPQADGFKITASGTDFNGNNGTYIYVAIRRPHKQPSAGTDVFAVESLGATSPSPPGWTSGFPVDWAIRKTKNTNSNWEAVTRATSSLLYLNQTYQESSIVGTNDELDLQNGWFHLSTVNAENYSWMFKRAPGFFDVATWTGDGVTGRTINHNLTVAPEFMIVKRRSGSENWHVYHKQPGATKSAFLNSGAFSTSGVWNDTEPTATTIALLGDSAVNGSGEKYVGYFFATVPGVSKVGHYTGTGQALNVDCGFTNGARFVLTKRIDASGDWTLFDTARGIVAGNESRLSPNQSSAENTSDSIDPYSQGFALTTDQGDTNVSGGTYLFLAIA